MQSIFTVLTYMSISETFIIPIDVPILATYVYFRNDYRCGYVSNILAQCPYMCLHKIFTTIRYVPILATHFDYVHRHLSVCLYILATYTYFQNVQRIFTKLRDVAIVTTLLHNSRENSLHGWSTMEFEQVTALIHDRRAVGSQQPRFVATALICLRLI
jgi:hypothetical protein